LIHYIHSGKGTYHVSGKKYTLNSGEGFLIFPNVATYYEADDTRPWHYSWIGFHGINALNYLEQAGLSVENPIISNQNKSCIEDLFNQVNAVEKLSEGKETRLLGLLYLILSNIIDNSIMSNTNKRSLNHTENYVRKAVEFLEKNYSTNLTIEDVAHNIGLSRKYLSSLFALHLNITPQQFLINIRMKRACKLLKNNQLSVGDVSRSVGYEDPLLFSKMFSKYNKISPREFRKHVK
jgi:AraC-like DNA-binding protein